MSAAAARDLAAVDAVFVGLSERGAFRGFDRRTEPGGGASYRFRWLRDQQFTVRFDPAKCELRVPDFLRDATTDPPMAANLRRYLATLTTADRPSHRQVDPARATLSARTTRGAVSLAMRSLDGDLGWLAATLIEVMNESYMMFLNDPLYYDYRVRVLNAHPDWG